MAFVLEDGTGLVNANGYIDTTFANAYHTDRGNDGWEGDDTEKQAAIVQATDYIDTTFEFRGLKKVARRGSNTTSQALEWPRKGALTIPENETVLDTTVPVQIQAACAELALAALTIDLLPDATSTSVMAESKGAGPLSKSTTFRRAATLPFFHKARRILGPLLLPDGFLRA